LDTAKNAGLEAQKAAGTDVMPSAEMQVVIDAEAAVTVATNDLNAFKTTAGNDAFQAVLDEIALSQIALDKATSTVAYFTHRCITDAQKAHYDKKINAEKEMWGYNEMSDTDKKIFDDYITRWTAFHQE
jgi:hypothetical protein